MIWLKRKLREKVHGINGTRHILNLSFTETEDGEIINCNLTPRQLDELRDILGDGKNDD